MSNTSQASPWSHLAYSTPTQHQYSQTNCRQPMYSSSSPGTNMQLLTNGEAYCNQYQARVQENSRKGYMFTQPSSSDPMHGNHAAVSYTPQTTQAAYQWAGADMLHTKSYEVQGQTMAHCGYQTLAPPQGQCGNSIAHLQEKIIHHEPCINTLTKLEADVGVLKEQSVQHQLEIRRLNQSSKRKDTTISLLKQQMSWQEFKINRLTKDSKEKDVSIEVLNSEKAVEHTEAKEFEIYMPPPNQEMDESRPNEFLSEKKPSETMKQELARLRLENREIIRLRAKLCKMELDRNELKRVKEENVSQREKIARLEHNFQTFDYGSGMFCASPSPFVESSGS